MEEVVHEIRDDPEALLGGGVVAVGSELTSLKTAEGLTLFLVEVGAVSVEPLDRLGSDLIALGVVGQGELAVRDKVREDEVIRLLLGDRRHLVGLKREGEYDVEVE